MDASLRWQIFSDFSFFANYGLFIPGKAFGYSYQVAVHAVSGQHYADAYLLVAVHTGIS